MNDPQCIGVCVVDPDTGACLGCGRLPEEISGVPVPSSTTSKKIGPTPLPPQVEAAAKDPTD